MHYAALDAYVLVLLTQKLEMFVKEQDENSNESTTLTLEYFTSELKNGKLQKDERQLKLDQEELKEDCAV